MPLPIDDLYIRVTGGNPAPVDLLFIPVMGGMYTTEGQWLLEMKVSGGVPVPQSLGETVFHETPF